MIFRNVALFVAMVAVGGCLDMSPLDYEGLDAGAPVDERALEAGPGTTGNPACDDCLFSDPSAGHPGCGDKVAYCFRDAKCQGLFTCSVAGPCLHLSDQTQRNLCLYDCVTAAGVSDFNDPAIANAFAVMDCSQQVCSACVIVR